MGCWAIDDPFWSGETPLGYGKVDDEESIRAIHAALDLGINFFDTADVYGAGQSENVLARAFADRRSGDTYQWRTYLTAGCTGLVVGAQRADHSHPWLPHGVAGRRELRSAAIWSADECSDARN